MNRRAKFDAASFVLGGVIRNRTYTQKTNKQVRQWGLTSIHTCRSLPTRCTISRTVHL